MPVASQTAISQAAYSRKIGKFGKSSPGCRILSNLCLFLILRGATMPFSGLIALAAPDSSGL